MANLKVRYYDKNGYTRDVSFDVIERGMTAADRLKICMAAAEILLRRLREFLAANTHDRNAAVRGTLAASLTAQEGHDGSVIVAPQGKHHGGTARAKQSGYHRSKTGMGTSHLRKRHGMSDATSAADVGWYLEYGTSRMSALHWMETVCEQCADELHRAMEQAWDAYLKSKGL